MRWHRVDLAEGQSIAHIWNLLGDWIGALTLIGLEVREPECYDRALSKRYRRFRDGVTLGPREAVQLIAVMRGEGDEYGFWCRLAGKDAEIHVGQDGELYVGTSEPVDSSAIPGLIVKSVEESPFWIDRSVANTRRPVDGQFWQEVCERISAGLVMLRVSWAWNRGGEDWFRLKSPDDVANVAAGLHARDTVEIIDPRRCAAVSTVMGGNADSTLLPDTRLISVEGGVRVTWSVADEVDADAFGIEGRYDFAILPCSDDDRQSRFVAAVVPDADGVVRGLGVVFDDCE